MRIVVDGCDGVGKSTLAAFLANKYKLDICHCTQSDPRDYSFYSQTIRKDNIIWDRHFISELIYPYIFNRPAMLSEDDASIIVDYCTRLNVKVLILTADPAHIYSRLSARGTEDPLILSNYSYINERFLYYAQQFNFPVIDTTTDSCTELFHKIVERYFIHEAD